MKLQKNLFPELPDTKPLVIAGPCSAETEEQVMTTATALSQLGVPIFRAGIWKPRTKPGSFEGVGSKGLRWLQQVQQHTGMKTAIEVATPQHVEAALKHNVDLLWIGARSSTNPFAVQEIANALKGHDVPVLVKNPMTPDLELWIGSVERMANAGVQRLGIVHRGFSTYHQKLYRSQPHWRIVEELRRLVPDLFLCCDPSHMGGSRELIAPLSQQAMDMNFDGLMIETHCCPDEALSDKQQQITPERLSQILHALVVRNIKDGGLSILRSRIDEVDGHLLELLSRRMEISREIGMYKKEHHVAILQTLRYKELMQRMLERGELLKLDSTFVNAFVQLIHEESYREQMKIMKETKK